MTVYQIPKLFCTLSCIVPFVFGLHTQHVLASPGCGTTLPDGQAVNKVTNVTIESDNRDRTYLIFVPPTYTSTSPAPLILSYHGGDRTALSQLQLDSLTSPYFNNNSIIVYPQGINKSWQGVPNDTVNDLKFTTDIISSISETHCLDTSRISATGKSDGGGFVNLLACNPDLSTKISAFAPVSGAYYVKNTTSCRPETIEIPCCPGRSNIPLLAFHGGNDTIIHYNGEGRRGECLPAIPHFIREWAKRDGLGKKNVTKPVANHTVEYVYGNGEVGLYYESDIGHDWPSTKHNADNEVVGHHNASYNATPIILDFFEKWVLPM